ncbi:MAG TPA: anthranilate synthase component I family protein [Candidatus Limnocylindria bacterium]|nr:anthranilate synthase component I family protein [Candidatus Limnocylindria bacterium]
MKDCTPTRDAARALAAGYALVPVYREVLADMLTPVRAYSLLCPPGEPGFLLESVEGGERLARYSFIGVHSRPLDLGDGNPLDALATVAGEQTAPVKGVPRFHGGAVGYLGYETARHFEKLPVAKGAPPPMPESSFVRAEDLAVFDHVTRRLQLLTIHRPDREDYDEAVARLDAMEHRLAGDQLPAGPRGVDGAAWQSNVTRGQFHAMVDAAREHIMGGDAFQVVVSQRFHKPLAATPFDVYRCLRAINPSPYMFFVALGGDRHVVGTSPEKLVQVEDRRVETRPLAGTRRRGADQAEDRRLEEELLHDLKERAEHVMLVDLGRNDVGRVAKPGTVTVDRLMEVERYSHVMHISSTVSGQLRDGRTSLDALRAAFPAGTVSGAPKIRAMEIIADLEPDQRGVYAGSAGYVSFGGNLDMAITLRTVVVVDGIAYVQAGAGVVADSKPEREFEETLEKAGAMFKAIEMAEAM